MITPDFSAYALKVEMRLDPPVGGRELGAKVEELLSKIARACGDAGAILIGHIKGVVDTPDKGFRATSVLEPQGRPASRGELQDGIAQADLVINVLLYGLTKGQVREIVDPLAEKEMSLPGARVKLVNIEEKHDTMVHFQDH
jgi:hypothetical protein